MKKTTPKKAAATPKIAAPAVARRTCPSGVDGGTDRDLRKGALEPDARLDLHGMTESVAHRALVTFVRGAGARGLRLLLIVTGKGAGEASDAPFDLGFGDPGFGGGRRGVLKALTPRWLKEPELAPLVADIRSAHRKHGAAGALYVYLRKKR